MEYTTYLKENNFLVITNDTDYLVFRWTGKECIVAKCDVTFMGEPDLTKAKNIIEEVRAADPNCEQVNWKYPLERVDYAIGKVQ